jgi:hypothetical protein
MSMLTRTTSLLKVLNGLNWAGAVLFFLLVSVTFIPAFGDGLIQHLEKTWKTDHVADAVRIIQVIAVLILPIAYATHRIFMAIIAILKTAIAGDPFIAENASRLRTVGWALLVIQFIDLIAGILMIRFSETTGEYWGWSLALTGWLAALFMFVLAGIFERGAEMREELEGTV